MTVLNLWAGSILLARDRLKILSVENIDKLLRHQHTTSVDVRADQIVTVNYEDKLLLLGWAVLNKTAILTCLHNEKKIVLVLPEKELVTVFSVYLSKPENARELTETERWLTGKHKVRGMMFRSNWSRRPKCIEGTFDEYVGHHQLTRNEKLASCYDLRGTTLGEKTNLVVGRAIRVCAGTQNFVFEFYSNGRPYWWSFQEKRSVKSKRFFDYWDKVYNPGGCSDAADVRVYAQICTS